ncbi:MAG: exodeoxyribonuclease VII small subunit [Proteobacteria bacterium]|nr:exodeoxyribonuclease VII small subunit [Pseudomonadota bacterium]
MAKDSFEKDLENLEDIVARLESEEVSLEDSMKLYEEGVKLARLCSEKLDKAEKKVEILSKDKNGAIKVEPFTPNES